MFTKTIVLTMALALATFNVSAEGITIEPGEWEMNSVINMPMLPRPRVTTVTECMTEDEITPESMMKDMDNSNADCDMQAEVVGDNTMKWTLECSEQMGNSSGEWEATSYGDTMKGEGAITMLVQGQEIIMTMAWEGKRIGDCEG